MLCHHINEGQKSYFRNSSYFFNQLLLRLLIAQASMQITQVKIYIYIYIFRTDSLTSSISNTIHCERPVWLTLVYFGKFLL